MRTLVIETSTAACSVALIEHGAVIAAAHEVVGRGHAERLVPMIAELPDGGRAAAILVDCGPGSFTGIRVGIAAARGLALGWGAEAHGYSSLALVAAAGFAENPDWTTLAVVLEGGHGEVFMQLFDAPLLSIGALASLKPEAASAVLGGRPAIGNGVRFLRPIETDATLVDALPRAADAILLPPALTALPPRPIYGRAPDAKPLAALT
ncbi:tRNA (adenosine(37)-N6)-threonylcarbamoyltransferase complex dimerization subunit type 1 TsaB [Sphingomonas oligophenolica]|uniref:tRNA (Adenosine(37)-N6)-threonylcarbamoyltransferase complex dimerization subunit type 1 TsaB n=1 Tax=Sphingomonas oligophenolica TaxID=301154 RepID=A0ABU9Y9W0_9SPHN